MPLVTRARAQQEHETAVAATPLGRRNVLLISASAAAVALASPEPSSAAEESSAEVEQEAAAEEAEKLQLVNFSDEEYGFSLVRPQGWNIEKKPGSKFYCADPAVIFGINRYVEQLDRTHSEH